MFMEITTAPKCQPIKDGAWLIETHEWATTKTTGYNSAQLGTYRHTTHHECVKCGATKTTTEANNYSGD
jgi:hypothetical protein